MTRPDNRPLLAAVAVPALVVCGRADGPTPPAVMAEMAAAMPRAAFVVIEDAGHLSPLEQPRAVSAVLRYWMQT